MTNAELKVLSDLCHDFAVIREEFDKCREELALEKKCHEEVCEEVIERSKEQKAQESIIETMKEERLKYCDRIRVIEAERDDARRKLGALLMCVRFLKDYDTHHPKRSLESFKAVVQKCINDNHIELTEGGMAK